MLDQAQQFTSDLSWPTPLKHRVGESLCLDCMDIFYDFNWFEMFNHDQSKFPGGLNLVRLVREQCPSEKQPALLLTKNSNERNVSRTTDTHYLAIVKIETYLLKLENSTAAAAYFISQHLGETNTIIPISLY